MDPALYLKNIETSGETKEALLDDLSTPSAMPEAATTPPSTVAPARSKTAKKNAKRAAKLAAWRAQASPEQVVLSEAIHAATMERRRAKRRQKRTAQAQRIAEGRPPSDAESEGGDNECIKCGERTHRDWCPGCGRPAR